MNKVMLVGRLTRDPELRSLPSGKHIATFTVATNEFRGGGGERTEYHPCVAWDRLAEICGQFLSKGQLVDVEGRLQTRRLGEPDTDASAVVGPVCAEGTESPIARVCRDRPRLPLEGGLEVRPRVDRVAVRDEDVLEREIEHRA